MACLPGTPVAEGWEVSGETGASLSTVIAAKVWDFASCLAAFGVPSSVIRCSACQNLRVSTICHPKEVTVTLFKQFETDSESSRY